MFKASLKHDKLLVNGTVYTKNTIPNLPADIKPEHLFTKTNNNTTGFFRKWSPLSNHYRCPQTVNKIKYNCNEQYYLHQKAKFFADNDAAKKIMNESDPGVQKKLGRSIKNVNETRWRERCIDVMKTGLMAKFTQNEALKLFLLNTGQTTLVECSPTDKYWGIGMGIDDFNAYRKNSWTGKAENHLGLLLMSVRKELKK